MRYLKPMALTIIFAVFSLGGARADNQLLGVADYLDLERVDDPRLSPDGSQVIYTRKWVDARADRWVSSLWIMDADGSRNRFLIDGSNARWSPGGDRILFIAADEHDKPQIFVRWMDAEGAVSQVTRTDLKPYSPKWSPDGKSIAYAAIVPAENKWEIELPTPPEDAKWTEPPRILDRLHYRQDRVGFTDPGFMHLFVVPAESGSARQLTSGEWNVGAQFDGLYEGAGIDWTPDGRKIVFDGWKEDSGDSAYRRSAIYLIDIESREIQKLTEEAGMWSRPSVSQDGQSVAYLGFPESEITYELPRIHVMGIDGNRPRQLSAEFDKPAAGLIWDEQNQGLYFTAQDAGYINAFHMSLGGDVRRVTDGKHTFSLASSDRSRTAGVGVYADFTAPGDVAVVSLQAGREPQRLTAINADLLVDKDIGEQEELWFTATDGNRAHGWLVFPPDFDPNKKYPMIMEVHGGPFSMYRGAFDFRYHVFAANGYVVLYTNPRGSTGYGERFSQAIDHAYPSVDYLDLMAGVDAAVSRGFIDENRMYVGGCSGGGVLSSWIIGHTDRFAAAAVRCPVSNWLSMAGTTDIPGFTYSFFERPFWEDPSKWLEHSPLMYVGEVTTPTIVMTGEQDMRTPMAQSEEYYAALKVRGVPSKLLRFNEQYHGTSTKPSNAMRTLLYMMDWYGQWTEQGPVEEMPED